MQTIAIAITAGWYLWSWYIAFFYKELGLECGYPTWAQLWKRWILPMIMVAALSESVAWMIVFTVLCVWPTLQDSSKERT